MQAWNGPRTMFVKLHSATIRPSSMAQRCRAVFCKELSMALGDEVAHARGRVVRLVTRGFPRAQGDPCFRDGSLGAAHSRVVPAPQAATVRYGSCAWLSARGGPGVAARTPGSRSIPQALATASANSSWHSGRAVITVHHPPPSQTARAPLPSQSRIGVSADLEGHIASRVVVRDSSASQDAGQSQHDHARTDARHDAAGRQDFPHDLFRTRVFRDRVGIASGY